jgi:hypothetical protein
LGLLCPRPFVPRLCATESHTKLAAPSLSIDYPDRLTAKAIIVTEVERLRGRIGADRAKNAQRSINWIRKFMHVFQGENGHRTKGVPSRKLWHALHEVDKYLSDQNARLVNYAKRYRANLRVGTRSPKARRISSSTGG